ncbi:ImmA/IrrE family metallo-endopeptidase [Priestia megaterium]|uniref:ImmA/IrrE family metallo-endopeptidase n=1 Tax=Priestia megaterium TaxID=1404 RepID=UPI003D2AFDDC
MITKENVRHIIKENRDLLIDIKEKISLIQTTGNPLAHIKPLEYMKDYLNKNANVILYPSRAKGYGGLVCYRNNRFYIHINTAQPKVYENFMWAHEFYHYYFEREKIKDHSDRTFIDNSFLDEKERRPNLFASEILINHMVLEEKFKGIKQEYPNEYLGKQILHLIPSLEVPYKAIVIKLAQDELITEDQAEEVIDFNYKENLPFDFDQSYLKPSGVIKIDKLDQLIENAREFMNEDNINSFLESYKKNLELVTSFRRDVSEGL